MRLGSTGDSQSVCLQKLLPVTAELRVVRQESKKIIFSSRYNLQTRRIRNTMILKKENTCN